MRTLERNRQFLHSFNIYKNVRFFTNLNGLRFICIAMVLWHHAPPVDIAATQLFGRGFMGVDFFFILSGFLITTLLLRESHINGRFSIRSFYIKRILRIFPLYFFIVSAVASYYILVKGHTDYLQVLPYYYLFLSNFLTQHIPTLSITWSLAVEEQYYILWPFLLLIFPYRFLKVFLIFLILANVFLSTGLWPIQAAELGPLVFRLPNSTYAPILIGSLLAIVLDNPRGFYWFWFFVGGRWASLLLAMFLALTLQLTPEIVLGWPNLLIHCVMSLLLASLVIEERSVLSPLLTARTISRIGEISYGIYLYHLIALDIWMRLAVIFGFGEGWLRLVGYSVISIIFAEISFRTLEAWFHRFRPVGTVSTVRSSS